jgi:hypothetical protein
MACERGTICESDLGEAAMLFAALQQGQHFSARDYSEFAKIGAVALEEEQANEVLLGLVERQHLREIGPGVYAMPVHDNESAMAGQNTPPPDGRGSLGGARIGGRE